MKRIVLKYGLMSGGLLAALTAVMLPLCFNGVIDFSRSQALGYASMVLAFVLVFFGIRTYREEVGGGFVSFGKAFQVGILITLITCAIYVVCWEVAYWGFFPDFLDRYSALSIARLRASGADEAAVRAMTEEMARFAKLYANPLFNVAITFLEVFPVGLIVTLISAAILRRRRAPAFPTAVATA